MDTDSEAVSPGLSDEGPGVTGRADYAAKLGAERVASLKPEPAPSGSVDYGDYR